MFDCFLSKGFVLRCIALSISLSVIACISAWAAGEEFYTLDVGQGNCQVAFYPVDANDSNTKFVAVIGDCGSSSSQKHPKFELIKGTWVPLFTPVEENETSGADSPEISNVAASPQSPPRPTSRRNGESKTNARRELTYRNSSASGTKSSSGSENGSKEEGSSSSFTTITSDASLEIHQSREFTLSPGGGSPEIDKSTINELLRSKGVEEILIFLSHTDKDHINYLVKDGVLKGLDHVPTTVYLSGDWLGKAGESNEHQRRSKSVFNVLHYLFNREVNITQIEIPWYWQLSDGKGMTYNKLMSGLREYFTGDKCKALKALPNEDLDSLSQEALKSHFPRAFRGNLNELYKKAKEASNFESESENEEMNSPAPHTVIGENIYIWGMNIPSKDPNSHSLVFSCRLPSLHTSVVLTGDADESVFQSISASLEATNNPYIDVLRGGPGLNEQVKPLHHVILTLPHHGSVFNKSGVMEALFSPSAVMISAGNGRVYPHPHSDIAKPYLSAKKSDLYKGFKARTDEYGFLAFKSGKKAAKQKKIVKKKSPAKKKTLKKKAIKKKSPAKKKTLKKKTIKKKSPAKKKKIKKGPTKQKQKNKGKFYRSVFPNTGIPIFCTNVYGSIRISSEGIFYNSGNSFEINGKAFVIKWEAHILEDEGGSFPASLSRKINGENFTYTNKGVRFAQEDSVEAFLYSTTGRKGTKRKKARAPRHLLGVQISQDDDKKCIYFYLVTPINREG